MLRVNYILAQRHESDQKVLEIVLIRVFSVPTAAVRSNQVRNPICREISDGLLMAMVGKGQNFANLS